jgi:hypothetical protein
MSLSGFGQAAYGRNNSEVGQADCVISAAEHALGGAIVELVLDQAARLIVSAMAAHSRASVVAAAVRCGSSRPREHV